MQKRDLENPALGADTKLSERDRVAVELLLQNPKYGWGGRSVRRVIPLLIDGSLGISSKLDFACKQFARGRPTTVTISLVSKEYLKIAAAWLRKIRELKICNYILVCGDKESYSYFAAKRSPVVFLDATDFSDTKVNFSGFSEKALFLTSLKFAICEALLMKGHNVIFSDIDAFWLKDPVPYLESLPSDLAFQSVEGFPSELVEIWGFAACSGFFFLRRGAGSITFCRVVTNELVNTCDDQLGMNVALVRSSVAWFDTPLEPVGIREGENTSVRKRRAIREPVFGRTSDPLLRIAALPQTQFRRHIYMDLPLEDAWVIHPNSPKSEKAKLKAFRRLGIQCEVKSSLVARRKHHKVTQLFQWLAFNISGRRGLQ